jgi:hypothetical protein
MTRLAPCIIGLVIVSLGCATGISDDYDYWTSDPVAEDSYDVALEPSTDVPWETTDPFADPDAADGLDATDGTDTGDPVSEDVAVDPGTCTVADFAAQTMCAAGYKCTFTEVDTSGNAVPFCDVEGTVGYNETCSLTSTGDDCRRGYMCTGTTTDSRCRPFCSSDSLCRTSPGGANSRCIIELVAGSGSTPIPGVTLCSFHCEPLEYSTGCDSGQACRSTALSTGEWFTDCREAGTGTGCLAGTDDDCPAGQGCFTVETANECLEYCSTSTGSPCTYLETCTAVTDWPTWIGACL